MSYIMTNFQTYLYPNTVNIETCFEEELNFSEIIDVRSPNEFNEDHIPTAKNFGSFTVGVVIRLA